MNRINKLFFSLTIILCFASSAIAAEDAGGRAAYTRGGWIGARYVGMGMTGEVMANDLFAIYWNPAGLTDLIGRNQLSPEEVTKRAKRGDVKSIPEKDLMSFSEDSDNSNVIQFGMSAAVLDIDRQAGFGGAAFTLFNGVMGVGLYSIISTDIETTDTAGEKTGTENYVGAIGMLSYAWDTDVSAIGVTIKSLYERIGEDEFAGAGVDIGMQVYTLPFIKIGFVIQDIGTFLYPIEDTTGVEERYDIAYPTLRLGVAFISDRGVTLAVSGRKKTDQEDFELGLGLEYDLMEILSIQLGLDDQQFGAGFNFHYGKIDVSYALAIDKVDLGYNNIVSVKILF